MSTCRTPDRSNIYLVSIRRNCKPLTGRKKRQPLLLSATLTPKQVWVETTCKNVLTAALETGGVSTFLFKEASVKLIEDWKTIAKFQSVVATQNGELVCGEDKAGQIVRIKGSAELKAAEGYADTPGVVVMDADDWQIIPAENLVATFQGLPATLFGVARSADDAKVLLKALEVGTDGVVLRTDSPAEVRDVLNWIKEEEAQNAEALALQPGRVKTITQVGMGDRVAVDLCSLMVPGEGLLVGSYSQGLFLIHSECCESLYINSRPFRVNAGPVHAYVMMPGGKTAYLSELRSGSEVLIINSDGKQRTAVVGRTKIEQRPLVLVETELDGQTYSTFLQNAETVRLVSPSRSGDSEAVAVAVTELQEGDRVAMFKLQGARHTGIAIKESILER